jgi:methylmalonyl-CoA mutase
MILSNEHAGDTVTEIELIRSTEGEKGQQIENVAGFERNRNGYAGDGLKPLQATARERRNVFASLMEAVKTHSLGQISHALYEVGGEYRRNM